MQSLPEVLKCTREWSEKYWKLDRLNQHQMQQVLTYSIVIFSFSGRGDDGRLGHGDNGWKYVPRITQSLAGQVVIQVTCGSYHTAAVSGNGDLFTWGGGMYGKLGHGNEMGHSTPKRVEALAGLAVSQIACGSRHTVAVVSNGALYSWGDKEVSMILPFACSAEQMK